MKLTLKRTYRGDAYTIGHLYIDGEYFCDTLEDVDRGLTDQMTEAEIIRKKVYGETAIPMGCYEVSLKYKSGKFGDYGWARPYDGKLPRLMNVPGYEGVLLHVGSYPRDTAGCILCGENKVKGQVINSRVTFDKLMARLKGQSNIIIEIY